jgi:hypothetical protein
MLVWPSPQWQCWCGRLCDEGGATAAMMVLVGVAVAVVTVGLTPRWRCWFHENWVFDKSSEKGEGL